MTDFDALAATWDDDPAKVVRAQAIADAIAASLPLDQASDALEYGCGTGLVTWALTGLPGRVTLADSSAGMLEVAQRRIAALPVGERSRYSARLLDLETESLPAASVDLIYTSMVLHHVADIATVLGRFHDALRASGHLAIADLDHDPHGEFHGHGHVPHDGFDRTRLTAALASAGFSVGEFATVATVTKDVEGHPKDFPVFLVVATA